MGLEYNGLVTYQDRKRWFWLLSLVNPLIPLVGIAGQWITGNEFWDSKQDVVDNFEKYAEQAAKNWNKYASDKAGEPCPYDDMGVKKKKRVILPAKYPGSVPAVQLAKTIRAVKKARMDRLKKHHGGRSHE